MKSTLFLVLIAVAVAGCASPTPYQRIGINEKGGYSTETLRKDLFNVTFAGNEDTKPATAYDFALLRAAEITIESGYDTFVIESERDLAPQIISSISTYNRVVRPPRYMLRIHCYAADDEIRGKPNVARDLVRDLKAKYQLG